MIKRRNKLKKGGRKSSSISKVPSALRERGETLMTFLILMPSSYKKVRLFLSSLLNYSS
jgi:hypothetical protein